MKTISILDNTVVHVPHLFSKGDRINLNLGKIIVTDKFVDYPLNNNKKFAYLVEPQAIKNYAYYYIKLNFTKFDKIFTHDKSILDLIPNSTFVPYGSTFIEEKDFKIYQKTKTISMIASDKTLTPGHMFRHIIRKHVQNKVDVFGRGIKTLDYKLDGLENYKFSIAMENSKLDYYFTEKILDCFLTGTIPIYWGCPKIGEFFNLNGILTFDSLEDLEDCLKIADESYYDKNKLAIEDNFNLAKKYLNPFDKVYDLVDLL